MFGGKGLIQVPQNKGMVEKKKPSCALSDHYGTKTLSKMLLTLISIDKHELNFTWKIILSFIWMVLLVVTVEYRWRTILAAMNTTELGKVGNIINRPLGIS